MPSLQELMGGMNQTPPVVDDTGDADIVRSDAQEGDFDLKPDMATRIQEEEVAPLPPKEVYAIYKHNSISRFRVGANDARGFEFKGGILRIYSPEDEQRFLDLYHGLHPADKVAIVKLRNIENVIDPSTIPRSIRGAASTVDLAGRTADLPAGITIKN